MMFGNYNAYQPQAMCGVVRYPNTFAYNAGPSPFCGNGCCGAANI